MGESLILLLSDPNDVLLETSIVELIAFIVEIYGELPDKNLLHFFTDLIQKPPPHIHTSIRASPLVSLHLGLKNLS